ncbi:MAG: hypothetical protein ACLT76_00760 [Clostridium fessum]
MLPTSTAVFTANIFPRTLAAFFGFGLSFINLIAHALNLASGFIRPFARSLDTFFHPFSQLFPALSRLVCTRSAAELTPSTDFPALSAACKTRLMLDTNLWTPIRMSLLILPSIFCPFAARFSASTRISQLAAIKPSPELSCPQAGPGEYVTSATQSAPTRTLDHFALFVFYVIF